MPNFLLYLSNLLNTSNGSKQKTSIDHKDLTEAVSRGRWKVIAHEILGRN